jgi:anti-sigma regulatory factor (Ser/Thr protein kinase)
MNEIVIPARMARDSRLMIGIIEQTYTQESWEGGIRSLQSGWISKGIGVWDVQTGRKLREFAVHGGVITGMNCSPEGRFLASSTADGAVILWNLETAKEIMQFVSFRNGEWVAVTPEGYYTASLNGDAFLNVRTGTKITGIEPYRSTFYQPAVVEAALRLGDSELAVSEVLGCKTACTTIADMPEMDRMIVTIMTAVAEKEAELVAAQCIEQIGKNLKIDQDTIGQLQIAVIEGCINAIEHSKGTENKIYVSVASERDRLEISIESSGQEFIVQETGEPFGDRGIAKAPGRGWGLKLMKRYADDVRFEKTLRGIKTVLIKNLGKTADVKKEGKSGNE